MSSISATDTSGYSVQQQQLLAQIQATTIGSNGGSNDAVDGSSSATSASGMSRLSDLMSSDGTNQSGGQLATLASALGVDQSTLVTELQSGNPTDIANLLTSEALSASSGSSSSAADSTISALGGSDDSDSDGSDTSADSLSALDSSSSSSGSTSTSDLQTMLASLGRSGVQYDGKL